MTPDKLPRFHRLGESLYSWMGCNGRGVAMAIALVKRLAITAMIYYRWRDRRD